MPSELRRRTECTNCGLSLNGDYCSGCGQSAFDYRVSLGRMFKDFAGDYFNLNSRFFRSIGFLLTKPGALTREYLDGRKVSFINPIRIYIVASLVFFLVFRMQANQFLLSTNSEGIVSIDMDDKEAAEVDSTIVINDSLAVQGNLDEASSPVSEELTREDVKETVERLGKRISEDPNYRRATILKSIDYIPRSAFLLLPLFALFLKLIYIRRRRLYSEHFVHALHIHSFWFVAALLPMIVGYKLLTIPLFVFSAVLYLVLSLKKVYEQTWLKTVFKSATLLFIYLLILILVVSIFFFLGGVYEAVQGEGYSLWALFQAIRN